MNEVNTFKSVNSQQNTNIILRSVQRKAANDTGGHIISNDEGSTLNIIHPFEFTFTHPESKLEYQAFVLQGGQIMIYNVLSERFEKVSPARLLDLVSRTEVKNYSNGIHTYKLVENMTKVARKANIFMDTENNYGVIMGGFKKKELYKHTTKIGTLVENMKGQMQKQLGIVTDDEIKLLKDKYNYNDQQISEIVEQRKLDSVTHKQIKIDVSIDDVNKTHELIIQNFNDKMANLEKEFDAFNMTDIRMTDVEQIAKIITEVGTTGTLDNGTSAGLLAHLDGTIQSDGTIETMIHLTDVNERTVKKSNEGVLAVDMNMKILTELSEMLTGAASNGEDLTALQVHGIVSELTEGRVLLDIDEQNAYLTELENRGIINARESNTLGIQNTQHEMLALSKTFENLNSALDRILGPESMLTDGIERSDQIVDYIQVAKEYTQLTATNVINTNYSGIQGEFIAKGRFIDFYDADTEKQFIEHGHVKLDEELKTLTARIKENMHSEGEWADAMDTVLPDLKTLGESSKKQIRNMAAHIDGTSNRVNNNKYLSAAEQTYQLFTYLADKINVEEHESKLRDLVTDPGTTAAQIEEYKRTLRLHNDPNMVLYAHNAQGDGRIQQITQEALDTIVSDVDKHNKFRLMTTQDVVNSQIYSHISKQVNNAYSAIKYDIEADKHYNGLDSDIDFLNHFESTRKEMYNTQLDNEIARLVDEDNKLTSEQARQRATDNIKAINEGLVREFGNMTNEEYNNMVEANLRIIQEQTIKTFRRHQNEGISPIRRIGKTNMDIAFEAGFTQAIGMLASNLVISTLGPMGAEKNDGTQVSTDKTLMPNMGENDPTPIRDIIGLAGATMVMSKMGTGYRNNATRINRNISNTMDVINSIFSNDGNTKESLSQMSKSMIQSFAESRDTLKRNISKQFKSLIYSDDLIGDFKAVRFGALLGLGIAGLASNLGIRARQQESQKYQDENYQKDYKYIMSLANGDTPNYMIGEDKPININNGITPLTNLNYNTDNDEEPYENTIPVNNFNQISSHSKMSIVRSGTRR